MTDFFEYIDGYKSGSLTAEELTAFETAMQEDASLKAAVDNYDDAKRLSEGLLEMDILHTLQTLGDTDPINNSGKLNDNRLYIKLGVILGVISILMFLVYLLNPRTTIDKNEVLALYQKPIDTSATKSIDTIGMSSFEKGKYYYSLNRFDESVYWFELMLNNDDEKKMHSKGYFWLGAAHLELWDIDKAREAWQKSEEKGALINLELIE